MGYRSPVIVLLAGAWLALGVVTGCNGVLGIEEASPRDTPLPSSYVGPSTTHYAVARTCRDPVRDDCSKCMAEKCPAGAQGDPQQECLQDADCRSYMLGYSTCIGKACSAPILQCFEPMFGPNLPVPDCMFDCGSKCSTSPIFSTCQIYCGCMLKNCAKFSDMKACVDACWSLTPDAVNCRLTHCEVAPREPSVQHCDHATGGFSACPNSAEVTRPAGCPDRSPKSFYCNKPEDCCSLDCDLGRGFCN